MKILEGWHELKGKGEVRERKMKAEASLQHQDHTSECVFAERPVDGDGSLESTPCNGKILVPCFHEEFSTVGWPVALTMPFLKQVHFSPPELCHLLAGSMSFDDTHCCQDVQSWGGTPWPQVQGVLSSICQTATTPGPLLHSLPYLPLPLLL